MTTETTVSTKSDNPVLLPALVRGGFDVRDFGAVGDGQTLDSQAINRAITAAHASGGGTVVFPAGDFLSHSIRLQSRVALQFSPGTTIIAADPPPQGCTGGYDAPEAGPDNYYQDFGHSRFRNSLIWGENLENVAIVGPGRIFGRGLSRGNGRVALPVGVTAPHPPDRLPDVLEADGVIDLDPEIGLIPGGFGYPNDRDTLPAGVGNKAIALKNCRNITLRDFTVLHGGHFAVLASGTDNLTIDNLLIDTNRDGIDVDSCCNVRISNCSVNSPWDDGICVKASCGLGQVRVVENVTIANCYVSGFEEGTLLDGSRSRVIRHVGGPIGRIKLGTEATGGFRNIAITNCIFEFCRGLALEQVDGNVLEDVVVSNLTMRDVMNAPIFIRLGQRLRMPVPSGISQAHRILISNVTAYNVAPDHGIFISGVPGQPVRDVRLEGLQLHFRGGGTLAQAGRSVPEMEQGYPEPMLFGVLPAWGLYVRHAVGLQIRDLNLKLMSDDQRPAVVLDDVSDSDFDGVNLPPCSGSAAWVIRNSGQLRMHRCTARLDTPYQS